MTSFIIAQDTAIQLSDNRSTKGHLIKDVNFGINLTG